VTATRPPQKRRAVVKAERELRSRGKLRIMCTSGRAFGAAFTGRETVAELTFRDGIMDRILLHERRFDERAYLFVLAALEFCQQRLAERRHISGRELAYACRDLALARFGVMARPVLEHWGVHSSADIGDVVFTLVDLGLLLSQPTDTREEFVGAFDFDEAFERDYPWCGAIPA
jgi:uncharacterized repeat protein (TIGR04138 family)